MLGTGTPWQPLMPQFWELQQLEVKYLAIPPRAGRAIFALVVAFPASCLLRCDAMQTICTYMPSPLECLMHHHAWPAMRAAMECHHLKMRPHDRCLPLSWPLKMEATSSNQHLHETESLCTARVWWLKPQVMKDEAESATAMWRGHCEMVLLCLEMQAGLLYM